jgi:putative phosphoribosyl transferase
MRETMKSDATVHAVRIPVGPLLLDADLTLPEGATGIVVFAHGSGSSRHSPRNRQVARALNDAGLATLLLDLLTPEEEQVDARTRHLRFDIPLLAKRLVAAIDWATQRPETRHMAIGCFGASTGAAAALEGAAMRADVVRAVVSRGGRPDLAGYVLHRVTAPTLLIVGGYDDEVLELNRKAYADLAGRKELHVVPGATHLFEEPGTLEEVARLAAEWFDHHLTRPAAAGRRPDG